MTGEVCFIDTETLGLDPDVHPVWEIGLIFPSGEFAVQIEVTDRELSLAHPKALEITGFHDRYGKGDEAPWSRHLAAFWLSNIIPEGAHLCGAVPSFDEERLRRLMWAEEFSPRWHYHLIDVEALAVGYLHGANGDRDAQGPGGQTPQQGPFSLPLPWDSEGLSRAVGVDPEQFERHTALGDARWARAIYNAVTGGSVG